MHDFRRLHVWHKARALAVEVHAATKVFPRADRGVVASQARRAALSIAANIAEGCAKNSRAETIRFLQIAAGSAAETEHHLIAASDLGYLSRAACDDLTRRAVEIQRMPRGLTNNLLS